MNSEKTILLVDDAEGVRTSFGLILEAEGYNIKLASNGVEAMAILGQSPVDLVVTDILMPEMDGIELATEVARLYPDIKLILISGGGSQMGTNYDYLASTQKLTGIKNLLKKPFEPSELIDTVQGLLNE